MLGVTHFVVFTKTDRGTNLRIARAPKGPTLTFRIQQYSLMKDVLAAQQKPRSPGQEYLFAPLLVLNNFTGGSQPVKLMATMFQNMFPSLNVQKMHISDCRRVVLLDYDTESESISFRHYYINVKPVGLSKSVKRIMNTSIPNLNKFEDIGDYVLREAIASESDVEDAGENVVTLSENYIGRNNQKSSQRAIRLVEIGPRMEMRLVKIENGFCDGEVIYHRIGKQLRNDELSKLIWHVVKRTPDEIAALKKKREVKEAEKAKRRKEQEENVKRKEQNKAEHKKRCLAGQGIDVEDDTEEQDADADKYQSDYSDFEEDFEESLIDDTELFQEDEYEEDVPQEAEDDAEESSTNAKRQKVEV